jgi:hypothetical protein
VRDEQDPDARLTLDIAQNATTFMLRVDVTTPSVRSSNR